MARGRGGPRSGPPLIAIAFPYCNIPASDHCSSINHGRDRDSVLPVDFFYSIRIKWSYSIRFGIRKKKLFQAWSKREHFWFLIYFLNFQRHLSIQYEEFIFYSMAVFKGQMISSFLNFELERLKRMIYSSISKSWNGKFLQLKIELWLIYEKYIPLTHTHTHTLCRVINLKISLDYENIFTALSLNFW